MFYSRNFTIVEIQSDCKIITRFMTMVHVSKITTPELINDIYGSYFYWPVIKDSKTPYFFQTYRRHREMFFEFGDN